ncbi:MAG: agmatinase [Synergistaceae bacterium]|jgi:agmatinase|nr:agmatinase [Synergistaceae bacterium]
MTFAEMDGMPDMEQTPQIFAGCLSSYEDARTVLFGVPYETASRRRSGADIAPQAMRNESVRMETFSPYMRVDMTDCLICDAGDLELPSGAEPALDTIESFCGKVHDDGKMPVMLGGEHIVTLGAVRAAASRWPDLAVLHFDAHADLKREFMGETFVGYTMMRRVWDLVGDGRIYQFGVRSGSKEEFSWAMGHVRMETVSANSIDSCAEAVLSRPVYITIDLDVIDPAELPGTGMPEAGGMSFHALYDALSSLSGLDVVGFDICELSPGYDDSGTSTALACKLLREMLIAYSCS